jgi:hypothetical protein
VTLPDPTPGLVIGYAYLWRDEALKGLEEGRKDRPCVIVLSVRKVGGTTLVTVAPITHSAPANPDLAVEISAETKARLGLDGERSWIIAGDLNRFVWPGVDLRPVARESQIYHYGLVPPGTYRAVRDKVLALAQSGRAAVTPRSE